MTRIRKCIHSFAWWLYNFTREDRPPDSTSILMIEVKVDAVQAIAELKKISDETAKLLDLMDEMQKRKNSYPMGQGRCN